MSDKCYTVWVGGTEVAEHYMTEEKAEELAQEYTKKGYDDVIVENTRQSINFIREEE